MRPSKRRRICGVSSVGRLTDFETDWSAIRLPTIGQGGGNLTPLVELASVSLSIRCAFDVWFTLP